MIGVQEHLEGDTAARGARTGAALQLSQELMAVGNLIRKNSGQKAFQATLIGSGLD
jgi:hypothetical protein